MAPRLTSKSMTLFVVSISVVPSSAISNFQSDLIFSTKLRVQPKNKHTQLSIKQLFKSRPLSIRFSNQMTWMTKILLGMNTA